MADTFGAHMRSLRAINSVPPQSTLWRHELNSAKYDLCRAASGPNSTAAPDVLIKLCQNDTKTHTTTGHVFEWISPSLVLKSAEELCKALDRNMDYSWFTRAHNVTKSIWIPTRKELEQTMGDLLKTALVEPANQKLLANIRDNMQPISQCTNETQIEELFVETYQAIKNSSTFQEAPDNIFLFVALLEKSLAIQKDSSCPLVWSDIESVCSCSESYWTILPQCNAWKGFFAYETFLLEVSKIEKLIAHVMETGNVSEILPDLSYTNITTLCIDAFVNNSPKGVMVVLADKIAFTLNLILKLIFIDMSTSVFLIQSRIHLWFQCALFLMNSYSLIKSTLWDDYVLLDMEVTTTTDLPFVVEDAKIYIKKTCRKILFKKNRGRKQNILIIRHAATKIENRYIFTVCIRNFRQDVPNMSRISLFSPSTYTQKKPLHFEIVAIKSPHSEANPFQRFCSGFRSGWSQKDYFEDGEAIDQVLNSAKHKGLEILEQYRLQKVEEIFVSFKSLNFGRWCGNALRIGFVCAFSYMNYIFLMCYNHYQRRTLYRLTLENEGVHTNGIAETASVSRIFHDVIHNTSLNDKVWTLCSATFDYIANPIAALKDGVDTFYHIAKQEVVISATNDLIGLKQHNAKIMELVSFFQSLVDDWDPTDRQALPYIFIGVYNSVGLWYTYQRTWFVYGKPLAFIFNKCIPKDKGITESERKVLTKLSRDNLIEQANKSGSVLQWEYDVALLNQKALRPIDIPFLFH